MERPIRGRHRAVGIAAALALLTATPPVASASGDGSRRSLDVEVTASAPTVVGGDFGCDPSDLGRCAGTFRNVRTLTGDFAGTAYQAGVAALLPDGTYLGQAVVQFTGSVDGCGSGTLVIHESGVLDPATGHNWGSWTITAGNGTGDLAGVSGTLSADSRVSNVTAGRIRCR